ncbi:MAG: hypothetical protein ACKO7V_05275, partial [Bacteroidota bacterium]
FFGTILPRVQQALMQGLSDPPTPWLCPSWMTSPIQDIFLTLNVGLIVMFFVTTIWRFDLLVKDL